MIQLNFFLKVQVLKNQLSVIVNTQRQLGRDVCVYITLCRWHNFSCYGVNLNFIEKCRNDLMNKFCDKGNLKNFLGLKMDYDRDEGF